MKQTIIVTGGAIIRDRRGRVLLQRDRDNSCWGLPGGGMKPGEAIEDTMLREVRDGAGLTVIKHSLYSIYSGARMQYRDQEGNEWSFVMFLFEVEANLEGKLELDGRTLLQEKVGEEEPQQLVFTDLMEIDLVDITTVQRPILDDLIQKRRTDLLRT